MPNLAVTIPIPLANILKDAVAMRASSLDSVVTAALSQYFQTARLTRSRGTKEPRLQENGRRQFQREATGVPRVCEWRAGVPGRLVDAPGQTDLVSLVSGQIAQNSKYCSSNRRPMDEPSDRI
jgi:hypothetical protein